MNKGVDLYKIYQFNFWYSEGDTVLGFYHMSQNRDLYRCTLTDNGELAYERSSIEWTSVVKEL